MTVAPTCRISPNSLQLEIDDLFPLGETLQLLRFAEFADADIKLTPAGKRFVDMDVDQRKKLFGDQLLANIPLAAHIKRVLDERPTHRAPATRFREELEDYMSEDYAERTLRAIINLGRYGELFAYDENAQAFSLRKSAIIAAVCASISGHDFRLVAPRAMR